MSTSSVDHDRLPVWATIGEAALGVAKQWEPLLRAVAPPALVIALVNVLLRPDHGEVSMAFLPISIFSSLCGLMIAISCHRLVILGPQALPSRWGFFWSGRATRFLLRSLGLGLIPVALMAILVVIPVAIGVGLTAATGGPELLSAIGEGDFTPAMMTGTMAAGVFVLALWVLLAVPAMIYLTSRLTLVLPATAVDDPLTFGDSWRLTSSNGWRMVAIMLLPSLFLVPLSLLGTLLPWSLVVQFWSAFTMTVLGVVGIASLSKAYGWLKPEVPTAG